MPRRALFLPDPPIGPGRLIEFPRAWTEQPQEAAQPVENAFSATSFAADNWTDSASGGRGVSAGGKYFAGDGSSRYSLAPANIRLDGPLWCAIWMERTATPLDSSVAYALGSGTGTAFFGVRSVPGNTDALELVLRRADGGALIGVGSNTATFPSNRLLCVVAVAPTGAASDAYIYVNGVKYNTASTAGTLTGTGALARTQSVAGLYRFGAPVVGVYSPWRVYSVAYGSQISELQAQGISLNAPAMFAPRTQRVYSYIPAPRQVALPRMPWTEQPQGATPPGDGWEFVYTPVFCSAQPAAPLAHHTVSPTPAGLSLESSGTSGGAVVSTINDPLWNFGTGPFTVVCVFRVGPVWTAGTERFPLGSISATNHWFITLRSDGTGVTVRDGSSNSGGSFNLREGDVVVSVHTRSGTGAGQYARQYRVLNRAGVSGSTTATDAANWYLRTATAMQVSGYASGGMTGGVLAVGMKRSATVDIDGLLSTPWQIFAPRTQRIYTSGSPLPTLSGADGTDITTVGFRPRVTAS